MTDTEFEELKACFQRRGLAGPTREEVEAPPPSWWFAFKNALSGVDLATVRSDKSFVAGPGFKVPSE